MSETPSTPERTLDRCRPGTGKQTIPKSALGRFLPLGLFRKHDIQYGGRPICPALVGDKLKPAPSRLIVPIEANERPL
jgi:hypothetical protein